MPPPASAGRPLDVRWLDHLGGRIGLTSCPGTAGHSVCDEPLARDLAAIRDGGASLLVTLMEAHELAMLGVPALGRRAEALGIDWLHLPIADMTVPDEAFEASWPVCSALVRSRLHAGRRVVLHCRGGRGRTGLVAARLLAEDGVPPDDAIGLVRTLRPGAIETAAQEAHVRAARPTAGDPQWRGRVAGCLLGGAVGDAFGWPVEFDSLSAIRARHGAGGLREPVLASGRLEVTDDTQMTLFTAAGILEALERGEASDEAILESVRNATLDWYRTQSREAPRAQAPGLLGMAELWARRAPGNTCLSACAAGATGTSAAPLNDSKGCGGVMRTAPFGLVRAFSPRRAFSLAARAAAQTHGHPSGYLPAGAIAATVRLLADGVPLAQAAAEARGIASAWDGAGETLAALDAALSVPAGRRPEDLAPLGLGWVGEEALALGLFAALHARDFREAVTLAANHDGDSDSTASIAGQLWGAAHGAGGIPAAWIRPLDALRPLGAVLARWSALAG